MTVESEGIPDVNPEIAERALKGLSKILDAKQPPDSLVFAKWKRGVGLSIDALNRFAFGVIEWEKTLGRPTTAALAGGFAVEAWRWDEVMEYTPQGVVFRKLKFPYAVSLWDGKDDIRKWRVYFLVNGLATDREHYVEARFSSPFSWTQSSKFSIVTAGFRAIEPSILGFKRKDAIALPKFEVILKGFADL